MERLEFTLLTDGSSDAVLLYPLRLRMQEAWLLFDEQAGEPVPLGRAARVNFFVLVERLLDYRRGARREDRHGHAIPAVERSHDPGRRDLA